jgi:hypothetical protein
MLPIFLHSILNPVVNKLLPVCRKLSAPQQFHSRTSDRSSGLLRLWFFDSLDVKCPSKVHVTWSLAALPTSWEVVESLRGPSYRGHLLEEN